MWPNHLVLVEWLHFSSRLGELPRSARFYLAIPELASDRHIHPVPTANDSVILYQSGRFKGYCVDVGFDPAQAAVLHRGHHGTIVSAV